ncbi:esterase/lipase family protein [Lentzea sp. NPDC102401]|uniref:esterase/lipase family protein n=1 Tax=Lentzea sp. NPDC102401 TaxID=3364128 RepID=UPI0038307771
MSNDLVVVLPGILGSTLRSRDGLVWAPSSGAVLNAIKTFGRSITRLRVSDGVGDGPADDGVEPVALMPDFHVLPGVWTPLKGYDKLVERLENIGFTERAGNLVLFPYDWRLSNRYNAGRLKSVVQNALGRHRERHPNAKVVFVCHSMGGLIARWYIEKCGGHEVTAKLITIGTPYRGAAKALGQLVNGTDLKIDRLSEDFTNFARSMPSLHQLMPEYACIEGPEHYLRTTEVDLPDLKTLMVADAMKFHQELHAAEKARQASLDSTHAILGVRQPTATTAQLVGGRIIPLPTYNGEELFGDATVPLVGGARPDVDLDSSRLKRVVEQHTSLQADRAVLDEIEGIITAKKIQVMGVADTKPRVTVPDLMMYPEKLPVSIDMDEKERRGLKITVKDEHGADVRVRTPRVTSTHIETEFDGLAPGAYTVTVGGLAFGSPVVPVTGGVLVVDPQELIAD